MLTRYWFEFDLSSCADFPPGLLIGCGVTAFDYPDAISIIKSEIFKKGDMPPIKKEIENIDVAKLDSNHVIPNMGVVTKRAVWFPLGYS